MGRKTILPPLPLPEMKIPESPAPAMSVRTNTAEELKKLRRKRLTLTDKRNKMRSVAGHNPQMERKYQKDMAAITAEIQKIQNDQAAIGGLLA